MTKDPPTMTIAELRAEERWLKHAVGMGPSKRNGLTKVTLSTAGKPPVVLDEAWTRNAKAYLALIRVMLAARKGTKP